MQVVPIKPKLKPPGTKRLKLECDILLSTSAFKFNFRRFAQAVRDTQLLWIPAAGLESLALAAPRAFVSLVWRMGAR